MDRPGFDKFVDRLNALGLQFTLESCPEDLYDLAQSWIHYRSAGYNNGFSGNANTATNNEDCSSIKEFMIQTANIDIIHADPQYRNNGNSENNSHCRNPELCAFLPTSSRYISNLIKTNREVFGVLIVSKKQINGAN